MKRTTPNASGCLLILSLAHLILYSSHQSDYCKKAVYILIYCINMRGINEFSWCEWAQFGYNSNFYVLILYLLIFIFLQSFSLVLFWTWLLLKFLDSEYISVIYCAHLLKFRTTTLVVYFLIDFLFFLISEGVSLLVTWQICSKINSWKCLIFLKIDVIILERANSKLHLFNVGVNNIHYKIFV